MRVAVGVGEGVTLGLGVAVAVAVLVAVAVGVGVGVMPAGATALLSFANAAARCSGVRSGPSRHTATRFWLGTIVIILF